MKGLGYELSAKSNEMRKLLNSVLMSEQCRKEKIENRLQSTVKQWSRNSESTHPEVVRHGYCY